VCRVDEGPVYVYDGNGNMTGGNGREVKYTPGNKVSRIMGRVESGEDVVVEFAYGGEGQLLMEAAWYRGYTGQEEVAGSGLVNMNGRVYDEEEGRFLTCDPTVQFEGNLQSYKRYSYAMNNPLRYTDPTGYFISRGVDFGLSYSFCGCSGVSLKTGDKTSPVQQSMM